MKYLGLNASVVLSEVPTCQLEDKLDYLTAGCHIPLVGIMAVTCGNCASLIVFSVALTLVHSLYNPDASVRIIK